MEENESVMGTCDQRFTLGSMLTNLKLVKARFKLVDIDPCVNRPSRVPLTASLYPIYNTFLWVKKIDRYTRFLLVKNGHMGRGF